jgi:polysaccharide chain length determinant protein (PEP-CTERM system associated)
MNIHSEQRRNLLINEAFSRRKQAVAIFVAVNLIALVAGLSWPKGFSASSTILVDDKKIIQPLMQGAAVATEVADRARMAREVIYGRKMLNQVLADVGWLKGKPSPEEQEKIIEKVSKRITITGTGKDIIKIEYRDDDPERAFRTTQRLAELFIAESLGAKAAESQAAFDFIDKQTEEYHEKLSKAEEQLKEFRSANLDARPGSDADISSRLSTLQTKIEQTDQELKETEVKKISLEKQLSGEAEVATVLSREGQYRSRIAELQSQLDTLRLSYLETYPDIVRIKHQIDDLKEAITSDRAQRDAAKASGKVTIDENVINNPMYQQLKRDLSQTQITMDTLNARLNEAKRQLQQELERGRRVHGGEATLTELTRDYQVNRDIYQDLLKRRENARVSMHMDTERQGLNFKIQEPATLPLEPIGLRFIHIIIGGMVLGTILPFLLIYLMLQVDQKIRIGLVITEKHKIPLLATIPHMWVSSEVAVARREVGWLSLAVSASLLVTVGVSFLRIMKVF